ncbi:hypothetical protein NDN01_20585 [Sphingomonas sp. QA11]|nr:hypothetical protein NDN01_20585 [Sphingomonas sp. QA11]
MTVEEFNHAGAFADNLGRHAAATATAATTEAATAAAAETTAAAATAAKSIAATAETVATATESITAAAETIATAEAAATEIIAAETVALIAATPTAIPAASFIETHALFVFPASPKSPYQHARAGRKRGCSDAKPIAPPSRCSVNPVKLRINSS